MKKLKTYITVLSLLAMTTCGLHADGYYADDCYCEDLGGYGYEDCCRASCIAPAVALGTIALVAIIAVAVQNSHGGSKHAHQHSN